MNKQPSEDYIKKAKDIFRILNEIRKHPNIIIRHLERLRSHFDPSTKILSEPGKIRIQMVEDISIFDDAIEFLSDLQSLNPLQWDENLGLSALEHVLDIGPKGLLRFESSDGTSVEDRIRKYGNYIEHLGESIDYGPNDAMGVLVSLILDDGEPEKPDRYNLFRPDYLKVGIACGPHKTEYQITVFDFAFDFVGHEENEIEGENEREQDMEGEEFIEFSQNKIDPNDLLPNTSINNGNGSSVIKTMTGINFPDSVKVNPNLNRSGIIKIPENNVNHNETDGEISEIGDNLNKMKLSNANAGQKNTNAALENNYLSKKTEENKDLKPANLLEKNEINTESLRSKNALNSNNKPDMYNNPNLDAKKINGDFKNKKQAIIDNKHNPLVKLTIEKDDRKANNPNRNKFLTDNENAYQNEEDLDLINNQIKNMNFEKKIISKQVEVVTKIIYTYEDGSIREVVEKNNHTYYFD